MIDFRIALKFTLLKWNLPFRYAPECGWAPDLPEFTFFSGHGCALCHFYQHIIGYNCSGRPLSTEDFSVSGFRCSSMYQRWAQFGDKSVMRVFLNELYLCYDAQYGW